METNLKVAFGVGGVILTTYYLIHNLTKNHYTTENRINLLENNIVNIKEKLADLELFKLKIYTNEISMGRRTWEEDMTESGDELD